MNRLFALTIIVCSLAHIETKAGGVSTGIGVRLMCSASDCATPQVIDLLCELENRTGEGIVISLSDATLDGPIGTPGYLHRLAGGQRYENVLQFGARHEKAFNRGSISHPWVDLTNDDMKRLRRLAAGESATVAVQVDGIEIDDSEERQIDILTRLKLIYASETRLRSLQSRSDLPDGCSKLLEASLSRDEAAEPNRIGTRRPEHGSRIVTNGCNDRISELFEHVFSNFVEVRIP